MTLRREAATTSNRWTLIHFGVTVITCDHRDVSGRCDRGYLVGIAPRVLADLLVAQPVNCAI